MPTQKAVGTDLAGFRDEIEATVRAIARFEPVTLIADPADVAEARDRCGDVADVVAIPSDCCRLRGNGPIFVRDADDRVAGVHFDFNGWGERFVHAKTAEMPPTLLDHPGIRSYRAPFICEGGGISVDSAGLLITTEQVMRNENRYAGLSQAVVDTLIHDYLGTEQVIWLGLALVEDTETDGHVDNVVEFVAPGVVLAQTVRDTSNPNELRLAERESASAEGRPHG